MQIEPSILDVRTYIARQFFESRCCLLIVSAQEKCLVTRLSVIRTLRICNLRTFQFGKGIHHIWCQESAAIRECCLSDLVTLIVSCEDRQVRMIIEGTRSPLQVVLIPEEDRLRKDDDWSMVVGVYDSFSEPLMVFPEIAEISPTTKEYGTVSNRFLHLLIREVVETGCISNVGVPFGTQVVRAGNPDEMIAGVLILRIIQERAFVELRDGAQSIEKLTPKSLRRRAFVTDFRHYQRRVETPPMRNRNRSNASEYLTKKTTGTIRNLCVSVNLVSWRILMQ